MKNSARNQFIASFFLLAIVGGMYYAAVTYVAKESERLVSIKEEVAAKTQDSVRLSQTKTEDESLSKNEAIIENYYIDTANIVSYFESLQATGKALGAKVEVVSVAANKTKDADALTLALRITGPFESVMRTLGTLENAPTHTVFSGLTIDTSAVGGSSVPEWSAATMLTVGIRPHTVSKTVVPSMSSTTTASTSLPKP